MLVQRSAPSAITAPDRVGWVERLAALASERAVVVVLLVAPVVVFLLAFFVLPVLLMISYSITGRTEAGVMVEVLTLDNYRRLVEVELYRRVLVRTLRVALVTCLVCIVLAYPLALVMVRGRPWLAPVIAIVVIAPLLVNVVVRSYGWTIILNRQGLLNWLLTSLGLVESPGQLLYTEAAVIIGSVHVFLPFMVLPLAGAIARIDPAVEEAGRVLGASGWTLFRRITLPLSLPGLAVGTTLVFSLTAGSYVTPQILGGNFSMLLGVLLEQQVLTLHDWPFGAAIATVLVTIVLAINLLYLKLVDRRSRAWTAGAER